VNPPQTNGFVPACRENEVTVNGKNGEPNITMMFTPPKAFAILYPP